MFVEILHVAAALLLFFIPIMALKVAWDLSKD